MGENPDLAGRGYTAGSLGNDPQHASRTLMRYSSGQSAAASALAKLLGGVGAQPDAALPADHLSVVLGTSSTVPAALGRGRQRFSAGAVRRRCRAPAAGSMISALSGGGIPCAK